MLPTRRTFLTHVLLIGAGFFAGCSQPDGNAAIDPAELVERLDSDSVPLILDVRSPAEFAQGHIPGAVNVAHSELASRLSELGDSKSVELVVYCESGGRASRAAEILREQGFSRVRDLTGHMRAWRESELPVAR